MRPARRSKRPSGSAAGRRSAARDASISRWAISSAAGTVTRRAGSRESRSPRRWERAFPRGPAPDGSGESVLVLNDHGLGDTIQFSRYLPMMARAGVAATFVCPAKLHRLLALAARRSIRREAARGRDVRRADRPQQPAARIFDPAGQCPGRRFPICSAEPELRRKWAARIGEAGFKIGVVWQGNPNPEADIGALDSAAAFRPARRGAERPADFVAEGLWRRAARAPAAGNAGGNARRGLRCGSGRVRRRGGGDRRVSISS